MTDPAEALKGDQMEVKTDREFIAWCREIKLGRDRLPLRAAIDAARGKA